MAAQCSRFIITARPVTVVGRSMSALPASSSVGVYRSKARGSAGDTSRMVVLRPPTRERSSLKPFEAAICR
jgi:hypothetical protein